MNNSMRTKTILLFLALAIVAVVFYACKKDKNENLTETNNNSRLTEERINNFVELASLQKNGKLLKNSEKMPIDSALFYISAAFNYTYCFPHSDYNKVKFDSAFIKIPILDQEGKTWLVDALSAYNHSIGEIREKYKAIEDVTKNLLAVVVQVVGMTSSNDSIITRFISLTGFGTRIVPQGSFGINDQYWWTTDGGNCTDIYNIEPGVGAPIMLANHIRMALTPIIQPGNRVYYTDPQIANYSNPTQYSNSGVVDNFCDYKFYYATEYLNNSIVSLDPMVFCLGIDPAHPGEHEMNFYFGSMIEVFSEDYFVLGRNFMDATVWDEYTLNPVSGTVNYYRNYMHYCNLTHGIMHIVPDGIYPIEIIID